MVPTFDRVFNAYKKKGYRIYDNEAGFDLNIGGIRTDSREPNKFDDFVFQFYRANGQWIFNLFIATTDPGLYWLENPMNIKGTAILVPGQYKGGFKIGKHKGKYECLVQKIALPVYRDNNNDRVLDYGKMPIDTGFHGIHIHRASASHKSVQVDKWSAGCQVLADPLQFGLFMSTCRKGAKAFGDSFTYTLLEEKDL